MLAVSKLKEEGWRGAPLEQNPITLPSAGETMSIFGGEMVAIGENIILFMRSQRQVVKRWRQFVTKGIVTIHDRTMPVVTQLG